MKLTKEEYKALEDIVGPEYITQEPVIKLSAKAEKRYAKIVADIKNGKNI